MTGMYIAGICAVGVLVAVWFAVSCVFFFRQRMMHRDVRHIRQSLVRMELGLGKDMDLLRERVDQIDRAEEECRVIAEKAEQMARSTQAALREKLRASEA